MSIVDDLVSNFVEPNGIRLNGAFTITLVDGGVSLQGRSLFGVRDQKKNKDILKVKAPVYCLMSRLANIIIPLAGKSGRMHGLDRSRAAVKGFVGEVHWRNV